MDNGITNPYNSTLKAREIFAEDPKNNNHYWMMMHVKEGDMTLFFAEYKKYSIQ